MVKFPPLAPSALWMSAWLTEMTKGADRMGAIDKANLQIKSPKEFGRIILRDVKGENIILSAAIAGGSKRLKRLHEEESPELSEHGDWRKNHLGAFEACLGKKPYYRYLEPALKEIYLDKDIITLSDFNTALFKICSDFLVSDVNFKEIGELRNRCCIATRGKEILENLKTETGCASFKESLESYSILQGISTYGKEFLLVLLINED